jgi:alpha-glucosidase
MERRVDLPLDFLGAGSWKATRYTDGTLTRPAWKTPVSIASEPVTSTSKLHLQLNAAGGQAILFDPS